MTCLVRNWSVVPAHCSRPTRDRHAWSEQGGSRFRFAQKSCGDGKRRDAPRGGRTPDYGEQARSASACVPHVHMQAERAAAQRGHADPECGGRAQRGLSHLAQFDNSLSHDTTPSTPSGTCPAGMSPWRVLRARLIGTSHRRRGGVRWPVGSRLLCFSGARLGV